MSLSKMVLIFIYGISLSACAISPARIAASSDFEVCRSYGIYKAGIGFSGLADQYRAEIVNRRLISEDEWQISAQGKIRRGMSLCALYASWGNPDKENRSVGAWGTHVQHVYHSGLRYVSAKYVYTENGKVTSWQY